MTNEPVAPVPWGWADAALIALLGLLVAALHPGLLLGGVLADLDAFAYFLPYRDLAAAALREGRLPLWNPLIFGGAPFLANLQTAVFYPATWLGLALDTPRAVAFTLLLHLWLAGGGMYALCRTVLALPRLPSLLGGVTFCLSGTLAAHAGHLNQVSAAAWLPLLLLLYDVARRQRSLPLATLGGMAFALQVLAGHPQVAYLSGVVLGLFALWRAWSDLSPRPPSLTAPLHSSPQGRGSEEGDGPDAASRGEADAPGRFEGMGRFFGRLRYAAGRVGAAAWALGVAGYMAALGAALAAVQLLPAAELSGLSIRAGGMTMEQAGSFSLPPWELLRGLLPAYYDYPFGEYVAYLGVAPLALGVLAVRARQRHPLAVPLAVLAAGALVLALGHFLPLFWAAYHVPGGALFRVPARWLLLWTFAGAALAAIGLRDLSPRPPSLTAPQRDAPQGRGSAVGDGRGPATVAGMDAQPTDGPRAEVGRTQGSPLPLLRLPPLPWGEAGRWVAREGLRRRPAVATATRLRRVARGRGERLLAAALLVLVALAAWQHALPSLAAVAAWLAAGLVTAAAVWLAHHVPASSSRFARWRLPALMCLLLAVSVTELAAARQGLPHLTAYPAELATGMRPAYPAVLELGRAGRILGIASTAYEPGDVAAVRARLTPPLTPEQAATFLGYSKVRESGAPNTGMLAGVATLDGYDGGVLPLRSYGDLKRLLSDSAARRAPPDLQRRLPQPDGLLRLELPGVPDAGLLAAAGVRGVILDRIHDAWADGAYYDLAIVRTVEPQETLRLRRFPDAQANALGLVTYLEGAGTVPDGAPLAEVRVYDGDGGVSRFTLRAGTDSAEGRYDAGKPEHGRARVAASWRAGGGQSYLARLPLVSPRYVQRVEVESRLVRGRLALHGLSLLDERLGSSEPVVLDPSFRLAYLGDLKVYENEAWLPGAWAVFGAVVAPPGEAAAVPGVLPGSALLPRTPDGPAAGLVRSLGEAAQLSALPLPLRTARPSPELVSIEAYLPQPGLVVFPEAAYPGWAATVDGQPAAILTANTLFQAVYVPEGRHRVEFRFASRSLQTGWIVTRAALAWSALVFAAWGLAWLWRRARAARG